MQNPIEPVAKVFERSGEVYTTSRDVAAYFDKEHRNVLAAIDALIQQEPRLALLHFKQGSYTLDSTGSQRHRCFDMNRDGFVLLVMGFTGPRALKCKMRYIDAFNAMEREIAKRRAQPVIDLDDPAALRGLLLSYSERTLALEAEVEELKPSRAALDRISHADGSLCITDAAKALQMRPKDLFAWLRANGWIYRRAGTAHDLGYQSKVITGYLEHKVRTVERTDGSEKIVEQVRVTAKGMARLAILIRPTISA